MGAVLDELENAVLGACTAEAEWPAQVAAGVCAGIDFAIERPEQARRLVIDATAPGGQSSDYERLIYRLAGFIRAKAPTDARLPASTDEAMVAGIVGLVGDHIRIGRLERLEELRPELVLLTLLPYLGFADAQRWVERTTNR